MDESLIDQYYDYKKGTLLEDKAKTALFTVIHNLNGRRGFDFGDIDSDIREEMFQEIYDDLKKVLSDSSITKRIL